MNINKNLGPRRRPDLSADTLVAGILRHDVLMLSRAITLIESTRPEDQAKAQAIIEACLPHSGHSIRIGITGVPGVGKSTFIEAFGLHLIGQQRRVAVLAVDPSSQVSRGSILGDKTRMAQLSHHPQAFVRPSPAGEALGGVARRTREAAILCEAAGFDSLIIETVGVGQSEISVHSMVDFFLLLLLPNAGDELQGIKRGIVEMADLIAVNKADGPAETLARQARRAYQNALHLYPAKDSRWAARAIECSALTGRHIDRIWEAVLAYVRQTGESGYFQRRRQEQALFWLEQSLREGLQARFFAHPAMRAAWQAEREAVAAGQRSPFGAAEALLAAFFAEGKTP